MARLLVVDDEPSILEFFKILLEREGYEVDVVEEGKAAFRRLDQRVYDLVITDLAMPEVDGMAVLDRVKQVSPETMVLMITAYATAESAVEAMKKGAYDYLLKPFKVDEIRMVVQNALEKNSLRRENRELRREVGRRKGFDRFVGTSPAMLKVFDLIDRVAAGRSSVLIVGESGTGKELAAKAVHERSQRASRPFVSVNCGAIPETLIESELFGYVRGAFTGAAANKMGLFEAAHQGTLLLDEVGELPAAVQVKLLRALEERAVRRIGATVFTPIDVRIVSATNRDLESSVREGKFREDLYYRLNVIRIFLPPLRERREDIAPLARHFLANAAREQGKEIVEIAPDALEQLAAYDYPGNVRELENIIAQSVALERSARVTADSLPERLRGVEGTPAPPPKDPAREKIDLEREVDSYEKTLLLEALRRAGGVKKKAAEILGITFRSMRYRLLKHGIDAEGEERE